MSLSNHQTLKQTQQLQLTPQLQQMMKLLQLSTVDLERVLDEAIQDNPLLEKTDLPENETSSTLTADLPVSRRHRDGELDEESLAAVADEPDFYDYLHAQVCEMAQNNRQAQLLHILIESLNEHGYLIGGVDDVLDHAPLEWDLKKDELTAALLVLQRFDPAGVGATNIRESLLLQLARQADNPTICSARTIVRDHFPLLTQAGAHQKLKKILKLNNEGIQAALDAIRHLNPYADSGFSSFGDTQYVRPDVRVYKENSVWKVAGEPHLRPRVVICEEYAAAVRKDTDNLWKQKLTEARALIQNLELRENTILQIARAIVERQQEFFEFGTAALNPLRLIDVAEQLNVNISTISRSVNQKYLICPQGLFELRLFFSTLVGHEEVEHGMSSTAIKTHIEEWIRGEDKTRPLSDDALRQKLATVGMDIARRTVTKYREELNIPSAYRRKVNC